MDSVDLPQLWVDENVKEREEKSFRVPCKFKVSDVIAYIYDSMDLKKHCVKTDGNADSPCEHLEILLKSIKTAPEDERPEYILLDNDVMMGTVRYELWAMTTSEDVFNHS